MSPACIVSPATLMIDDHSTPIGYYHFCLHTCFYPPLLTFKCTTLADLFTVILPLNTSLEPLNIASQQIFS